MTDVQTEFTPSEEDAVHSPDDATLVDAEQQESTPADLDREGDIAADYIEELLDIADIDGDIDIDTRNGRAYISVNAEEGTNLRLLSKPETVSAPPRAGRFIQHRPVKRPSRR